MWGYECVNLGILSQHIHIWNHSVAHSKYIKILILNYTSIKLKKSICLLSIKEDRKGAI